MSDLYTPWFPPSMPPERVGYYDTRTPEVGEMVLWWDGANYRPFKHSPTPQKRPHFSRNRLWRGLLVDLRESA